MGMYFELVLLWVLVQSAFSCTDITTCNLDYVHEHVANSLNIVAYAHISIHALNAQHSVTTGSIEGPFRINAHMYKIDF